ncbi:unnamed protein product [Cladocopium goreaui]|uniref:RING-type domain-containing protein n=1 Tax=Cladocopium goreaui TaxID=2562237 RepID=A0A9P1CXA8_9DINO|nr:unnamed protein product [Cladocopium goreaui]
MMALELGRLTAHARASQFQQADGWVKDTVQFFFNGCKTEAQKGLDSFTLRSLPIPEIGPCISVDQIADTLKAKLDTMGFASCEVKHYYDFQQHAVLCTLHASWHVVDTPAPPPSTGGCSNTCPICQEIRPVVVLVPCGHTLCSTCQGNLQSCPFCRSPITTSTNGLFMD